MKARRLRLPSIAVLIGGRTLDMRIGVSSSGARYVGGGYHRFTKWKTQGMLTPLAPSEDIASAISVSCAAP